MGDETNKNTSAFEAKLDEVEDFLTIDPWEISLDGVHKPGDKGAIYASPIPILPTAILENADTLTEKVELSFFKHGRWRSVVVDRSVTANKSQIIKLADRGVEVNSENASRLVRYIADAVAGSLATMPHKSAKSVLGWAGDGFMPYSNDIVFDGEEQFKHLYKAIAQRGKLDEWRDYVRPMRERLELRLCMAASFASPLVELVGENSFVFHLWGGTGAGKTLALMTAMSIWGDPAMGAMTRTMNMTQNAMLSTAAFLRNLPFAGDELQTIKSQWTNYDRLIMSITEGIDRGRMSYDKVNELRSWRCSFLFSGEEPCVRRSSGGGAKNRVIEVECVRPVVTNGNAVANFVRSNYGTAGPIYIDTLRMLTPEAVVGLYRARFNSIVENIDTTDKQAGAMAMMLVADDIASALFWGGEPTLTVDDVKQYLSSASEVDVTERAYEAILEDIARHGAKFTDDDREVWGRIEGDYVLINRSVLDDLLRARGFEFDAVKSKWRDKGYLAPNSQGKLVHQTKCRGVKAAYIKVSLPETTDSELPM